MNLAELIGRPDEGKEKYKCIVKDCTNYIVFGTRDEEFYRKKGWVDNKGNVIKPKRCKMHREEAKRFREQRKTQIQLQ